MSGITWGLRQDRSAALVTMSGAIDEDANFDKLLADLRSAAEIRFDLSGVRRINSCGVREWVNFVRSLPPKAGVVLEKCPSVVVAQINMISNFAANARVSSVHAPFICESCGHEEDVLVDLSNGRVPKLDTRACPECGKKELAFDDLEESYFAFLG